jgi:transporter family protein
VAPVDKLSVVVVMILAVLFLGENLSWQHWLGGGLIVSGTIVLTIVNV